MASLNQCYVCKLSIAYEDEHLGRCENCQYIFHAECMVEDKQKYHIYENCICYSCLPFAILSEYVNAKTEEERKTMVSAFDEFSKTMLEDPDYYYINPEIFQYDLLEILVCMLDGRVEILIKVEEFLKKNSIRRALKQNFIFEF